MKYLTMCGALLAIGLAATASPASAQDSGNGDGAGCVNCPAPKKFDSTEVIKQTRDVDQSQVIETESVVPSQRVIETNHLIIHQNETRHIGTVQHNHTIIEKELVLTKRNVFHKTVNTVVDLVEHKYNTVRKRVVEEREVPGEVRELRDCNCERPKALRSYRTVPRYVNSRY
ncbi:MAG: hypothetical protein WEA28_01750 [Xanthobacteraceae bacterium]